MENMTTHLEILNPDNEGNPTEMPLFDSFGSIRTFRYELRKALIPGEYYGMWTNELNVTVPVIVRIPTDSFQMVDIVFAD